MANSELPVNRTCISPRTNFNLCVCVEASMGRAFKLHTAEPQLRGSSADHSVTASPTP